MKPDAYWMSESQAAQYRQYTIQQLLEMVKLGNIDRKYMEELIKKMDLGSDELFKQEYPSSPFDSDQAEAQKALKEELRKLI